jgi:hypothetical protein
MKLSEKLQRVYTFGDFPKDDLIFEAIKLESAIEYFETCKNQFQEKGEFKND